MTSSPSRHLARAGLMALLALHSVAALLGSAPTNDDAFISFRYARNLSDGHGLVFNRGERVEGYTNFLWVLLLALLMPVLDPIVASKLLGLSCDLILITCVWRHGWRTFDRLGWTPALLLALDPGLIRWSTRGLETSLFALLAWATFQASVARTSRTPFTAALLAVLATLCRPEGVVAAAVALVVLEARQMPRFAAAYAAGLLPYLGFKLAYFGDILPNTYYAKTGGGIFQAWRGLAYVAAGWGWPEVMMIAIVIASAAWLWDCRVSQPAAAGAIFVASVIYVGGDSLGPDRFLVPVAPFIFAALAASLSAVGARARVAGTVLCASLALANAWPMRSLVESPSIWNRAYEETQPATQMGRCLREGAAAEDSIATSLIGRVPYYSGLTTLDVFGLVDPHIARLPAPPGAGAAGHEKTDPEYILSRRPTFIMAGNVGEVVVGPPRERPWIAWLRRSISGDPPTGPPRMLKPPFEGYELSRPCPSVRAVWRLVTPRS